MNLKTELCQCGCGKETSIIKITNNKKSRFVGQRSRFLQGHYAKTLSGKSYLVDEKTGCWVWQASRDRYGYAATRRYNGGYCKVSRIVFEKHKGKIPAGMYLDHLCRNPPCINPDHLEPVTPAENVRRGKLAKLNPLQVSVIKKLRKSGVKTTDLGKMFGVSPSNISKICTEVSWK